MLQVYWDLEQMSVMNASIILNTMVFSAASLQRTLTEHSSYILIKDIIIVTVYK